MITVKEAADLIVLDYANSLTTLASINIECCQSSIVEISGFEKPVLIIRGSDECMDWVQNFRFLPEPVPGDTVWWHRGFLHHAQIAYSFAKEKGVGTVIGHSLGAACVQIVASSLGVPGIGIASPQPLFAPVAASPRPLNATMVVNYCRTDDIVCHLPPAGFVHVGEVRWLMSQSRYPEEAHSISHYLPLLPKE